MSNVRPRQGAAVFTTPLDLFSLLGRLVNSKTALQREQSRLCASLRRVQGALAATLSAVPDEAARGKAELSNAGSEFLCELSLAKASPNPLLRHLETVGSKVERAMHSIQEGGLSAEEAHALMQAIASEVERLK
jgi:hypothetical protein